MDKLDDARRLRDEYEGAMDEAEARRADYNSAIIDLHRSGMPLREIAKELGISHQRVHQIVSGTASRPRHGGKVVGGAVAALVLAASLGLAILANIRTVHPAVTEHRPSGKLVAVPDVLGMTTQQALRVLRMAGLKPGRVIGVYSAKFPSSVIVDQAPDPGSTVRVGWGVQLLESKGIPSA